MKIKKRRSLLPALVLLLSCAACAAAPMTDPIMDSAGAVGEAGVSRIAAVLRNRGSFAVRYEEKWQLERYDEEEGIFVMAPYEEIQYKDPAWQVPAGCRPVYPRGSGECGRPALCAVRNFPLRNSGTIRGEGGKALLFGPRLFAPRMCPVADVPRKKFWLKIGRGP